MSRYCYHEDPVLAPVLAYWTRKRGNARMPRKADIDPTEMPKAALPHLQLIDVVDGGARFRYRLVGTASVNVYGADYTGKYINDIAYGDRLEFILKVYRTVCDLQMPVFVHNRYRTQRQTEMGTNRVYMPLSIGGNAVEMILGVLQFTPADSVRAGLWGTATTQPQERYIEPIELAPG